jgi:hypothetical protein
MSVSLRWRPVKNNGKCLSGGSSSDVAALERVWGGAPWKLTDAHLDTLRGMAALSNCDNNPYDELINKILDHDTIEVWPEY